MIASSVPGYETSSYQYAMYLKPSVILSANHFKFMLNDLTEKNLTVSEIPKSSVSIKLRRNVSDFELRQFKSYLNTAIKDHNRVI